MMFKIRYAQGDDQSSKPADVKRHEVRPDPYCTAVYAVHADALASKAKREKCLYATAESSAGCLATQIAAFMTCLADPAYDVASLSFVNFQPSWMMRVVLPGELPSLPAALERFAEAVQSRECTWAMIACERNPE